MGNSALGKINLGVPAFISNFTNGDLTAGILTVVHNLNAQYNSVIVYDNNGKIIIPDDVTATDANTTTIDLLSYGTLTGTWRAVVLDSGATMNSIASDLSLAGQAVEDFAILEAGGWAARGGVEKIFVGSTTKDVSTSSDLIITGVGFKPSYILLKLNISGTASASWGEGDVSLTDHCIYWNHEVVANAFSASGRIGLLITPGVSQNTKVNLTALGSDGFTLAFAPEGSPTGTAGVYYTCFR